MHGVVYQLNEQRNLNEVTCRGKSKNVVVVGQCKEQGWLSEKIQERMLMKKEGR